MNPEANLFKGFEPLVQLNFDQSKYDYLDSKAMLESQKVEIQFISVAVVAERLWKMNQGQQGIEGIETF